MYCDQCGTQIRQDQRFCASCGRSLAPAAPAPAAAKPASRLVAHARVLGVIWIVYGVAHLAPLLGLTTLGTMIFRPAVGHAWHPVGAADLFVVPLLAVLGGIFGLLTILGIIGGWALVAYQPWARTLLIVLACLSLLNFPLGTLLGAYTLWVLIPRESAVELARPAR